MVSEPPAQTAETATPTPIRRRNIAALTFCGAYGTGGGENSIRSTLMPTTMSLSVHYQAKPDLAALAVVQGAVTISTGR